MKKFLIYNLIFLTTLLYPSLTAVAADETDFFPTNDETVQFGSTEDTITTDADEFILDNDDSASSQVQLQFGATLNEYLQYNVGTNNFEISDDLDLNGNELMDFRTENLASDPATCDSTQNGRLYFNTTDSKLYMCDGTSWGEVGSGTATENLPAVQARRTTDYTLTSTFTDITFDTTDFENDATVVEHDNTNTDRIDIKESGVYMITYRTSIEFPAGGSDNLIRAYGRLRTNDTTVIAGSEAEINIWYWSAHTLTATTIGSFSAGDYISLQLSKSATTDTMTAINDTVLQVTKMEGITGPQGPAGSGSTITLQDEGTNVTNTPHSTLNFTGAGVTVTDAGSGTATISISGTNIDLTNIVYVDSTRPAQTGEVYPTLATAVSYVNTQSPSAGNPWVIKVEPGTNNESVTLPYATVLMGEDKSTNEFTGTITMSNGDAIQNITTGSGGMIAIPNGSSGTINNSDVTLNDGGDGIDGSLSIRSSLIDGTVSGTGSVTTYDSTIGTTSYTTAGTLETYNSSVLNITNTGTWNNYGVSYDKTQLASANRLDGSTTQSAIDELVLGTPADDFTLNENQTTAEDVTLTFGNLVNETLKWRETLDYFIISNDLVIDGNLSVNDTTITLDADNTGSGANTNIVAEQGTDSNGTLRYNASSNQWEISNNGEGFVPIAGWLGSRTRIKITPMDFQSDDADDNLTMTHDGDYHSESGSADPVGTFAIPTGFRATNIMIYGSDSNNTVYTYVNEIADGTSATSLGTGKVNTELDITDTDSTDTNYITIYISIGNYDRIYGGYITIEPIP